MYNINVSTEKKFNDFLQWKSNNLGSYNMEQVFVLKKVKEAIVFKDNQELSTFIKYFFGINFERQYFLDVFIRGCVVNYNKLINDSINYFMNK